LRAFLPLFVCLGKGKRVGEGGRKTTGGERRIR
jgi:hypothetical protein